MRKNCCSVSSSVLTCLGVCVLVLGYTLLGAFTFMALEGGYKDTTHALVMGEEVRTRTVEKLWSITEDLNILYKDNWTRLAAQEVLKFQDTLVRNLRGGSLYHGHHHHRWSFSSSFLYSLTLITTIGYGSVAPRTPWGKIITIVYALIGIPLMLVYLSTVGDVLARNFRRLYSRLCGNGSCHSRNKNSSSKTKLSSTESYLSTGYTPTGATKAHNNITADGSVIKYHHHYRPEEGNVLDCGGDGIGASSSTRLDPGSKVRPRHCELGDQVRVPISLCLMIILLYICGGALLFNRLENWSFLEGSYFCFTSLGTIGFGDLIPGLFQYHSSAEQLSVFASSAYILIGMAIIAMCFNLVQDEVVILIRRVAQYFGVARDGEVVVEGEGGSSSGVTRKKVCLVLSLYP
ncbi:hypothetical protein L9F63_020900, partial [Diploptera punctata]